MTKSDKKFIIFCFDRLIGQNRLRTPNPVGIFPKFSRFLQKNFNFFFRPHSAQPLFIESQHVKEIVVSAFASPK